jgi:peptide/nickel transport system substrate-binding protein
VVTVALVVLTVLAITGSVLSRIEEIPGESGGTLRVATIAPVGELDPARVRTAFDISILRGVVRTPYAYKPGQGLVSDLALGPPQISDDSRQVEITLREGVRFAPPVDREVVADDIAYAIERGFTDAVDSNAARLYFAEIEGVDEFVAGDAASISGIETPDDYTVVFRLQVPEGRTIASALTLPLAGPVPREYAEPFDEGERSTYARHIVATGPYRFVSNAKGEVPGPLARRIALERNPNWASGTDFRPAFADRIETVPMENRRVATSTVLAGEEMVSGDFAASSDGLRGALEHSPGQVTPIAAGTVRYASLNTRVEPLDDVDVRRALTAALNRSALQDALGGPTVETLATHWIPPGVPGFEEAGGPAGPGYDFLAAPDGDLALARSYMREAGYASGRYEGPDHGLLALRTLGPVQARVAMIVRNAFERLGIPIRVRSATPRQLLARCSAPRVTPAVCLDAAWIKDFDDAETVLEPLFSGEQIRPLTNDNWSLFDDPSVDRMIVEASTTSGAADRAGDWAQADRRITDLAPALPFTWERFPLLRSADVLGIPDRELGHWDLTSTSLR